MTDEFILVALIVLFVLAWIFAIRKTIYHFKLIKNIINIIYQKEINMTIIRNVIFIFLLIPIFSCNNKKSELSKSNANVDKKMIVIDTIITTYNIYEASKQALNVFDSVINTVEKCGYNYNDIAF
jgi:uncharacterized membrane protein